MPTLKDIVKFWLNKGISGFRIDAAKFFFEDELLRDEPTVDPNKKQATDYNDLRHIYTHDLWDCYVFLHNISLFIKDYSIKNNYNHQRYVWFNPDRRRCNKHFQRSSNTIYITTSVT